MSYSQRIATPNDTKAIAPLWKAFAESRSEVDPSMQIVSNFDYERYVAYQLTKPLFFCFVLEHEKGIVGFLSIYVYDEAPPADLPSDLSLLENPFKPRRVAGVFGLYVQKVHRKLDAINLLIDAATQKAESLKITDIDILVSSDQTTIHALLERLGYTKSAIQYTKHYEIVEKNLPDLHVHNQEISQIDFSSSDAIPLRDPLTSELVRNSAGDVVNLEPIKDTQGNLLKSSRGLSVYPVPLRDPQSQNWVFDESGNLVVSSVLLNEQGDIVEVDGLPQFKTPLYDYADGQLTLKRDEQGKYCFN